MDEHLTPDLSGELAKRIKLVRRDIGNLAFHFTRTRGATRAQQRGSSDGFLTPPSASAFAVLGKILKDGKIIGTGTWTDGRNCVCFTEAPIQEFNAIFSLVQLAASKKERPRYEPYGIAVSKEWLFEQGGRPVIYDRPDFLEKLTEEERYRFVPYDPTVGIDYTWEREWRIQTDALPLDPKHTLVVVPTADEAFEFVYDFAEIEPGNEYDGDPGGYHTPRWLAVSLDLFGVDVTH